MREELNDLADIEIGRSRLASRFGGYDFSHLPLDTPCRRTTSRRPTWWRPRGAGQR